MPGKKYKHSVSHVVPDLVPHRLRSDRTSHRQRPDLARPISCARTPTTPSAALGRTSHQLRAHSTTPSAAHGRASCRLCTLHVAIGRTRTRVLSTVHAPRRHRPRTDARPISSRALPRRHRPRTDLARPINSRALPRRHRPRSDARPISCARTPRRHRTRTDARPINSRALHDAIGRARTRVLSTVHAPRPIGRTHSTSPATGRTACFNKLPFLIRFQ
jgi:hypothetical protein